MAQKSVLGKGLASLLPSATSTVQNFSRDVDPPSLVHASSSFSKTLENPIESFPKTSHTSLTNPTAPRNTGASDRHMGISMAYIQDIQTNHFQPRRDFPETDLNELAQSIKTTGIIQPLVVRKTSKNGFELIAGERRLRAAKLAGLQQVPVVIRRSTDREALEIALIENIQRQDLNCIDEALAYFQLLQDFSLTQEEIANQVGKSRATIANFLRLLHLPESIIQDLKNKVLTFGHGKALLSIEDTALRLEVRTTIVNKQLSVRETEKLIESLKHVSHKKTPPPSSDVQTIENRLYQLEQELTRQWSAKIEMKGNDEKGKILLHYTNRSELDRFIEILKNTKK